MDGETDKKKLFKNPVLFPAVGPIPKHRHYSYFCRVLVSVLSVYYYHHKQYFDLLRVAAICETDAVQPVVSR